MQNYNEILQGYNDRLVGVLNQVTQIPSSQEKSLEIKENGQVEIIPDDGYVLTKVIANVNVASSGGGESGENNLAKIVDGTATEITAKDLDGATKIRDYAFYYSTTLTSIEIPNSVTSIGSSAFYNCQGLESVTIGTGVKTIDTSMFFNCKSLKSITINAETAPTLSNVNAFSKVPTSCIFYVKNLESYNSTNWVAIRDQYTFVEIVEPSEGLAYTLRSDGVSYSVSGIGTCTDTDIVIPDTYEGLPVTVIDTYAFSNNTNLSSVTIPNTVTRINSEAFSYCSGLTSITIPNSVTRIDNYAFSDCTNLTSVTIEAETAPTLTGTYVFDQVPANCIFYVRNVAAYQAATNWSSLVTQYTFEEIEE